jgi:hypothetical protein
MALVSCLFETFSGPGEPEATPKEILFERLQATSFQVDTFVMKQKEPKCQED